MLRRPVNPNSMYYFDRCWQTVCRQQHRK
ncbi:hypothetical protein LINGRAHAP2_LOCUS16189 [Linum grandiflorum]